MRHKEYKSPKIRSVKFNVVMNMITTTSSFLFPLITVPYVSRVLGPSGMGIVSWLQTFITYFALIAMLGMASYGIRACAEVRENKEELSQTAQELIVILLCSTTVTYLIYLGMIIILPKTRENLLLAFIFGFGIWLTSCGCDWFYQAIEQYGYITVRNIAFKFIGLILMFLLIRNPKDYILYGVTIIIGSYGSNILNILKLREFINFDLKRKLNLKRHFKPMASFTISSISAGMYAQIDMLLSGFFLSNTLVGIYQMVSKIRGICYSAVNSVGSVMLPRISYYESKEDHNNTKKLIGKNINFIFIISLGIIIILCLCGTPIIQILGGSQYLGGTEALAIISPVLLLSATNTTFSQYLIAVKREKEFALVNFCGLVLGIIFGCILIPLIGINGAALSVVLCELGALIMRMIFVRDFLKEVRGETDIIKIIISALVAASIILISQRYISHFNPFIQLFIDGCILGLTYLGSLLLIKERFILEIFMRFIHKNKQNA